MKTDLGVLATVVRLSMRLSVTVPRHPASFVVATRFPDQNVKELRGSHTPPGVKAGTGEDTALCIRYQLVWDLIMDLMCMELIVH